MERLRSLSQIRYYQKLVNQLIDAGEIEIDLGSHKWRGDIYKYVSENYHTFKTKKQIRDMCRYLLKIMDTELPTRNSITQNNINKCHFDKAPMEDLQHHISWLREQLLNNNIKPFDWREIDY